MDIWLLGNIVVVHVLTSLNFHNNFTHFPRNLSTTTKNILHIEISETKTTGRQFTRILISHILSLNSKKKKKKKTLFTGPGHVYVFIVIKLWNVAIFFCRNATRLQTLRLVKYLRWPSGSSVIMRQTSKIVPWMQFLEKLVTIGTAIKSTQSSCLMATRNLTATP